MVTKKTNRQANQLFFVIVILAGIIPSLIAWIHAQVVVPRIVVQNQEAIRSALDMHLSQAHAPQRNSLLEMSDSIRRIEVILDRYHSVRSSSNGPSFMIRSMDIDSPDHLGKEKRHEEEK